MSAIYYEGVTGNPAPLLSLTESEQLLFKRSRILVTGAGGSIGSRIFQILSNIGVTDLFALDRDENSLYRLSLHIDSMALFDSGRFILADIRDQNRIQNITQLIRPDIVIHCAAVKHLAILENSPREALFTNVIGTLNLIKASIQTGVSTFVNVSTDKAAIPSSVLGMSKRIAELFVIHARNIGHSSYMSVRFGNVFNSKGSVIETFEYQLTRNLPVTLTDTSVERFFMHVDEASFLVLKSVALNIAPIHLLDMGRSIKLSAILFRMKAMLQSKSEIVITGLRQGEKLNEDLIDKAESIVNTQIEKIKGVMTESTGLDWTELDFEKALLGDQQSKTFLLQYS